MIVLSEAALRADESQSSRDLGAMTEAARLLGLDVRALEPDFERCGDAEGALAHIPPQASPRPALWIGYIPSESRYAALHEAARRLGLVMLNSPEEHARGMVFDRFYPLLGDLTPSSTVVRDIKEVGAAAEQIGFPIFVKGLVQSRKARGLRACVADNGADLERLVRAYLELGERSRGAVVLRRFVPLRYTRLSPQGFPMGREYRVFLYRGEVLEVGYYWEGDDPHRALTAGEAAEVRALATTVAARIDVPYVAVDIAQATTGDWLVIETGDAQFCGVCEIPRLRLLQRLTEAVKQRPVG